MPPKKTRSRLSADERRIQLMQVAQRVFAAKGVNGTTVEELAAEAGITKPLIYEHFGGKEGLYDEVVEAAKADLKERLTNSVSCDDDTEPRQKLEQATCALFTYIQQEPDAFRTLMRDAPAPTRGASKVSTINDLCAHLEHLLASELEAAGRSPAPARTYAFMILGNATMLGEWWLERGQSYDRESMSEAMVNLLWNGFGALESAPTMEFVDC